MSTEGSKQLGETLRRLREERELSLKEVENAISIRISCLQAIEEGETTELISPVYAQGFIRQYATFLGIDPDKLLEEHKHALGVSQKQEFAYGIGTLEARGYPAGSGRLWPNLIYLTITLLLLVAAVLFAFFMGVL